MDNYYLRALRAELARELESAQYGREHCFAGTCGEDDAREERIESLKQEIARIERGE